MTTTVTVKPSSHDVEVFLIDPKTGSPNSIIPTEDNPNPPLPYRLITKDAPAETFHAHSTQDILIREVKE